MILRAPCVSIAGKASAPHLQERGVSPRLSVPLCHAPQGGAKEVAVVISCSHTGRSCNAVPTRGWKQAPGLRARPEPTCPGPRLGGQGGPGARVRPRAAGGRGALMPRLPLLTAAQSAREDEAGPLLRPPGHLPCLSPSPRKPRHGATCTFPLP